MRQRRRRVKVIPQKPYKVVGHISGTVYARAKTLREVKAQRRKVAKKQFVPEHLLDIVDPMGRAIRD